MTFRVRVGDLPKLVSGCVIHHQPGPISINMTRKELEEIWKQPPPGTEIVTIGRVETGDYFYVHSLGAWAPVPNIAVGEMISPSLIARPIKAISE